MVYPLVHAQDGRTGCCGSVRWARRKARVGKQLTPSPATVNIDAVDYQPAIDRKRPTLLRVHLTLPPESTIRITLPFSKAFIKYSEHPPDASRGFDLPPAILFVQPPPNAPPNTRRRNRIYSSKLLVDVPIPDFSMPYNVIIMTCTIIALFFGSVFNPLVRRFGVVRLPDYEKIA